MSRHLVDLLPEYAAGTLPEVLEGEVGRHLASCPSCTAELRALEDVLAQLHLALPAPPPPPGLRQRLFGSGSVGGRFERFVARMAALLDVAEARARELTVGIDDAAAWQSGPAASRLLHLAGGPRVAAANCGFVRLAAGAPFPRHRHLGSEHVLVLQGGFVDDRGREVYAGSEDVAAPGSEHSFTALPGADLIFLLLLERGIEMAGGPAPL